MNLLAGITLLSFISAGTSIITAAKVTRYKITAALIGSIFGPIAFTTLAVIISFTRLPLIATTVGTTTTALCITYWLWRKHNLKNTWRNLKVNKPASVVFCATLLVSLALSPKLIYQDKQGIATSIINAWGDLGWHVASITTLTENPKLPFPNPILADTTLTYPFLSNYLSAMLVSVGATIPASIVTPAIIFVPVFFTLFFIFTQKITQSSTAATLALILLIFSGSTFGWTVAISDYSINQHESIWQFLTHLPQDYAGNGADPNGWHFLNIITSSLLPQRAFLLGAPLGLAIVILLLNSLRPDKEDSSRIRNFILAGVLAGLMPITHAHTVLALVPIIITLFLISKNKKEWIGFFIAAAIIGLPEIFYFLQNKAPNSSFIRWAPGWTVQEGIGEWTWHWLKNTGLLLPTVLGAIIFSLLKNRTGLHRQSQARYVALAGLCIFITANLFTFAPWEWDNFRLFLWWLILSLPLISLTLTKLPLPKFTLATTAIIFVALHTTTGTLDLWKTALPTAPRYSEWDNEVITFAEKIKENTPKNAIIVSAPYHNNPGALTGRSIYLGFPGHAWSHGYEYVNRELAIRDVYELGRQTLPELTNNRNTYAIISPTEISQYNVTSVSNWELVTETQNYLLYKVN